MRGGRAPCSRGTGRGLSIDAVWTEACLTKWWQPHEELWEQHSGWWEQQGPARVRKSATCLWERKEASVTGSRDWAPGLIPWDLLVPGKEAKRVIGLLGRCNRGLQTGRWKFWKLMTSLGFEAKIPALRVSAGPWSLWKVQEGSFHSSPRLWGHLAFLGLQLQHSSVCACPHPAFCSVSLCVVLSSSWSIVVPGFGNHLDLVWPQLHRICKDPFSKEVHGSACFYSTYRW